MIHLRLHTEYSFRRAYGKVEHVIRAACRDGQQAAAITDSGTWGHAAWAKECKKQGVKPLLGVEVLVVPDARVRERQAGSVMTFLARNTAGLQELYELVTRANNELFYFVARLDYRDVNGLSGDVIRLAGAGSDLSRLSNGPTVYLRYDLGQPVWNRHVSELKGWNPVVACDNLYVGPEQRQAYEVLAKESRISRTTPAHILNEWELQSLIATDLTEAILNTERIAAECDVTLPRATMVKTPGVRPLYDQCIIGARERGMRVWGLPYRLDHEYQLRLVRELDLIHQKQFDDYFHLVGEMVRGAKREMFVGPARGSSAGSLVCYLLGITDVDPIVHDLMFERFIDITRADLPDIDIDFPDDRRDRVIAQLRERYGADRVGRIGTVLRYKAKSVLGDVARELSIPLYEIKDVQESVIERSTGDARAQFCVMDALDGLDIGKALVAKYPAIRIAAEMEGHATTSGTHAAGVIVCEEPIKRFASITRDGVAMVDKKDAEVLNLLKIDALGLTTLRVLQDCLDSIGKTKEWLLAYPLDDHAAFEVLNAEHYSGIFQFEGYALQSLTRQMKIQEFNDIVSITALARPGPLHCGAATEFISRRIGNEQVTYLHPLAEPFCKETFGVIIYQEQVMACGRAIGDLSWEDVSELRKAMSKSLGEEFFNTYWVKFEAGARGRHQIPTGEARRIWDKMCTFGSWAFNKSHAVSYGLLSYWCAVLKAHHPLQFAAAQLRSDPSEESATKILRELVHDGFEFDPVDAKRSGLTWSVIDGRLIGGLTNIKGIGPKKAEEILLRRSQGKLMTPAIAAKLAFPVTPYDDIFECERRFGDYYKNPRDHGVVSGPVSYVKDIGEPGDYVFLGRIKEKNLRDLNEYGNLVKRGGRRIRGNSMFLNLVLEDDTGSIIAKVPKDSYLKLGKPIIEQGKIGDWYLWRGRIRADGWRMLVINKWRKL